MKACKIYVTPESIRQIMQLPYEAQLYGAMWDFEMNSLVLYFHGHGPETSEGCPILRVDHHMFDKDASIKSAIRILSDVLGSPYDKKEGE